VLTKLGLTHEGRRRQVIELRDGWRDSDIYSILEHEWSAVIPAAAP
jgi:RimJ/RimL family protein N-acetyltransferase